MADAVIMRLATRIGIIAGFGFVAAHVAHLCLGEPLGHVPMIWIHWAWLVAIGSLAIGAWTKGRAHG